MKELPKSWPHRLSQVVERAGWPSTWLFEVGMAIAVGLVVAAVLSLLDGVSIVIAVLGGVLAALPSALTGYVALRLARALAQSTEQRDLLCMDDEAHGVSNRRQFLKLAERDWARCRRYGDDGAMLLIDTDYLRRINESMGQSCGDAVLSEITRRVASTLRQSDVLARFGGAELAVFLPHTDPLGALDVAERIRQQVASTPFRWDQAHLVVTVSVGVASVHAGQISLEGLIQEVETALSSAKEAGRNCVRSAPISPRQNDASSRPMTPH
jgi:diguanylate cyclase